MNFAQVKGITIPQGAVKQLSQGQTTLWKKSGGVPIGYRRLTGIEFDGQVWYDSGMYLQGSDTLKLAFEASIACNVLGCYTDASAQTNYSLYVSTSSTAKYLRYNGGTYNSAITANTRYDVIITPTGSDGMKVDSTWTAKTFTTPTTMMIGTTSTGATSAKLTGALYGDIEIVGREKLIPVKRASDGAIGYWMESAGVFLANLGTGTPVPTGYIDPYDVQVEYLEATGTQYLNTEQGLSEKFRIDAKFSFTQYANEELPIISTWVTQYNYWNLFLRGQNQPARPNELDWFVGQHHYPTSGAAGLGSVLEATLERDGSSWSSVSPAGAQTFSYSPSFLNPTSVKIFRRGDGVGATKGRIYQLTIYDNGVKVMDLIPVRIDQTGYLYDKVSGQLLPNAGTGDFVLGNDITA